jgi:glycosyltransferase involved in cell wall biosynthesis
MSLPDRHEQTAPSATTLATPPARQHVDPRFQALKRMAIVPALNEEGGVARVIGEIRAFDPDLEIVVVDDGSVDRTSQVAVAAGARVLRLPFNLGIGGAVQTGFRFAFENGYDIVVRVDGDGQHDASQLGVLIEPVLAGEADIAVGSRFAGMTGYRQSLSRNLANRVFAHTASFVSRQRVTDPSSGFQVLNRRAIALFAADYPHEFPEVEATVMVARHRLRRLEVPVAMRERLAGRSSIDLFHSVYFMAKVLLALFVGLFRRNVVPLEDR